MARNKTKATKLYVGKTFSLKNVRSIQIGGYREYVSSADLGHVLILNESQKRVDCWTPYNGGTKINIAKYYLHSEIKEEIEGNPVGELGKILTELADANKYLRSHTDEFESTNKRFDKLIRRIRVVIESLEKETKS